MFPGDFTVSERHGHPLVHEDLEKNPFAINIKGQLNNWNHVQNLFNDHAKFEFWNGLLCCDGL
jgi:hypothetical protein